MKNDPIAYERFWSTIRSEGSGWAKPPRSHKWHFFRGEGAHEARLCRDFCSFELAHTHQPDPPSPSARCPLCVQTLAAEFLRWNATAPIYILTFARQVPCPQCCAPVEWWTRPPRCIWLPPLNPSPAQPHQKGDQVYLDETGMDALAPEFHRTTCPDGYLYVDRKPWIARVEDDALELNQRRLDAKGE